MDIPYPESKHLIMDDCRRLTGPSLLWDKTGAILDVLVEDIALDAVLDCWYRQLDMILVELNWQQRDIAHRQFENGFNLVVEAPIDQLYSATLVLETAWYFTTCELLNVVAEAKESMLRPVFESIEDEANPDLIALQLAAQSNKVDFLADDDEVSVGQGDGSQCWPLDQLPNIETINWNSVHDIPVALVTGTNGKSTSVRILDAIAKSAGHVSGVTSTDFVRVGDDVLDRGDYSGPGGARLLLRDKRLQVAFLEVARGGMLRRGLPLHHARAALVTNVDRDHLGQYGINTLEALIEVKFIVAKALVDGGVLVVNADDSGIRNYLAQGDLPKLCWFSLDKNHALIQRQIETGGLCSYVDDAELVYFDGNHAQPICSIKDMPMAMNGAALHNVRNALGAIGVAISLGYALLDMRAGLCEFRSDDADNPGRLNQFRLKNGARAFVDFAHNAHSVAAVVDTIERLPAREKWVLFGSAGDRSDDDIRAIAEGVCAMQPDHVMIVEIEQYLRGRKSGEVSQLIEQTCLAMGLDLNQMHFAESPLAGVKQVLVNLHSDDLALFLVLSERDEIIRYLSEH